MSKQKNWLILGILVGIVGGFLGLMGSDTNLMAGIFIFLFSIAISGFFIFYAQFDLLDEINSHMDRVEVLLEYATDRFDEEYKSHVEEGFPESSEKG